MHAASATTIRETVHGEICLSWSHPLLCCFFRLVEEALADLMGPTGEQDDEPQLVAPQAAI